MILVCGRKLQKTTLQATLCVTGSYRAQMRSCEKPAGRQQEVAAAARLSEMLPIQCHHLKGKGQIRRC